MSVGGQGPKLRQDLLDGDAIVVVDAALPGDVLVVSIDQQSEMLWAKFVFDLEQRQETARLHQPDGALRWLSRYFDPLGLPDIHD